MVTSAIHWFAVERASGRGSLLGSVPMDSNDGIILLEPHPRRIERIFGEPTKRRLERLGQVVWHDGSPASAEHIERLLPQTIALIGQSALDRARLDRTPRLRAVFNVESNFLGNIDYAECHRRGLPVLSTAPVYARPVAEMVLAMAISLARRMHEADAALRVGKEFKGDNHDSFLLHEKPLAIVGFGNTGRALLPLLRPFSREILVNDPWIHPAVLRELDVIPATLDECFARARVVFLLAAVTSENALFFLYCREYFCVSVNLPRGKNFIPGSLNVYLNWLNHSG